MNTFSSVYKGPDRVRYWLDDNGHQAEHMDEIDSFWDTQYLSAGEAMWRIMGFQVTQKEPAVTSISVHLPQSQSHHQYHCRFGQNSMLSLLDCYFLWPTETFYLHNQLHDFSQLSYAEYYSLFYLQKFDVQNSTKPSYFVEREHDGPLQHVVLRSSTHQHISHIESIHPSKGNHFYLWTLLQHHPACSFEELHTVNGTIYATFQEAATTLGLFANQNEGIYALKEAINSLQMPWQLHILFIHLLVNECLPTPLTVWCEFQSKFAHDFILHYENAVAIGVDHTLQEMQSYLDQYGKCLSNYGLPDPQMHSHKVKHKLLWWGYDREELGRHAQHSMQLLTDEQQVIVNTVMHAVMMNNSLFLFIDGKAGWGKTFLVDVICDFLQSMGQIVLPTATSAFTTQLYPGGHTAHSAFKVWFLILLKPTYLSLTCFADSCKWMMWIAGITN